MALDLDLEGFGILESDSEATSKLSPTLNKQPPISPIESESSSGISSLDSDDLKKQLLASPPTISHEDHDDDDDDDQSDSDSSNSSSGSSDDVTDKDQDSDEKEDDDEDELVANEEEEKVENATGVKGEIVVKSAEAEVAVIGDEKIYPSQVMYENRNILNLAENVWSSKYFINYTTLPENNVNCFFQNRAQYWRLANNNVEFDVMEKCECCEFTYPAQINNNLGGNENSKNPITDSLKTFLKNNFVDQQNPIAPPTVSNMPTSSMNPMHHANNVGAPQGYNNMNNNNNKRMYNNGGVPYAAYQMIQQQQQQQQQQYPVNQNGYYGNGNGYNPYNTNSNNNNNNASVGAAGGYNGTALALLNLMNASRNVSGAAFQATMNNSTRYYNNINTSNNNGFGLYKQF